MNENNIVSIDAVIDRIKIGGYIDCSQIWNYAEDYEYDNILYYLEKYKDLQSKIDKAIEYVERVQKSENDINPYILHAPTLLTILKGDDK